MTSQDIQRAFARHTLNVEARRDARGRLAVYNLPSGDGGGAFEVAGINERYHPKMARRLRQLIQDGEYARAEEEATDYIDSYTSGVDEWHEDERVEGYLRCCAFNRGAKGACWILQYALKYAFSPSLYTGELDGDYGKNTKSAAARAEAERLLDGLYGARIVYERTPTAWKGSRDERSQFWHGLFTRFTTDLLFARSLK